MTCCRCNRTGKCQNCSCVKNGEACQSCLPLRLRNCVNTAQNIPSARGTHVQPAASTTSGDSSTQETSLPPSEDEVSPGQAPVHSSQNTQATPNSHAISSHQPQQSPSSSSNHLATVEPLSLPPLTPMADPTFYWGEYEAPHFIDMLNTTYDEAIHWRLNLFKIPYGTAGKSFTLELARMYKALAELSALESIALKAATIMPILLLQKPSKRSKTKDHIRCLQRCLISWKDGNLNELCKKEKQYHSVSPRM